MNKTGKFFLLVFSLTFLIFSRAEATTASDTVQFLKNVNLKYYSLSREGLKSFKCDVKIDQVDLLIKKCVKDYGTDDGRAAFLKSVKFFVVYQKNKKWGFGYSKTSPLGNGANQLVDPYKARIDQMAALVRASYSFWLDSIALSFINPEDPSKEYNIQKSDAGFNVVARGSRGIEKTIFNSNGQALESDLGDGGGGYARYHFANTSEGLILTEVETFDHSIKTTSRYEYKEIAGYWLLSEILLSIEDMREQSKKANMEIDFKNYELNGSGS